MAAFPVNRVGLAWRLSPLASLYENTTVALETSGPPQQPHCPSLWKLPYERDFQSVNAPFSIGLSEFHSMME